MSTEAQPVSEEVVEIPAGVSRRGVMRLMGASAVGLGLAGTGVSQAFGDPLEPIASDALPPPTDTRFWRQVRRLFTLDPNVLFMNVGTVGSPPKETQQSVLRELERVAREAVSSYSSFDDVRATMARDYGCDLKELAITHNTSDGMAKALMGLQWSAGDEILTTNHEHVGGLGPMTVLRDKYGVVIRQLDLPIGNKQRAEDYVTLFRGGITNKTKLIMFSSPTYKTGTMLPITMISSVARERGIPTLVDAAHIPGMMNYRFEELGVDFLAASMAKWQCGPAGTGVLYVRNKLTRWNQTPLPEFFPVISSSYPWAGPGERGSYDMGKYLTSVGNGPSHQVAGLASVCAVWNRIGRQNIENHILGLSAYLKDLVAERWGVDRLYSPKDDKRLVCALTSWNPFANASDVFDKAKSDQFVARVRSEHGITIRNVDFPISGTDRRPVPVRVSTHLFHDTADVQRVVEACWAVSRAMG